MQHICKLPHCGWWWGYNYCSYTHISLVSYLYLLWTKTYNFDMYIHMYKYMIVFILSIMCMLNGWTRGHSNTTSSFTLFRYGSLCVVSVAPPLRRRALCHHGDSDELQPPSCGGAVRQSDVLKPLPWPRGCSKVPTKSHNCEYFITFYNYICTFTVSCYKCIVQQFLAGNLNYNFSTVIW